MADAAAGEGPGRAKPICTEDVLRTEAKAIHGLKLSETGSQLYDVLFKRRSAAALCLSGGGIRSAAFALGVIQALAAHPRPVRNDDPDKIDEGRDVGSAEQSLLTHFHYLSTVSGGGYIGSWLSAWVTRAGFPTVWSNLTGRPKGPDIEPQAIAWLRAYSNYLTPKLGVMSADTWTAVTLVLRNLILNWFVILPVLCLVVLLLKLFAVSIVWYSQFGPGPCQNWLALVAAVACVSLYAALYFSSSNRPTRAGGGGADQTAFLRWCLVPLVLAGVFFSFALASSCGPNFVPTLPIFASATLTSMLVSGLGVGVAIFLLAWIAAVPGGPFWTSVASALAQRDDPKMFAAAMPSRRAWIDLAVDFGACAVAGAVFGMLMGIGAWLYVQYYLGFWFFRPGEVLLIVFGVPWTLLALLLASMIFVALSNTQRDSDADREWIARADGWIIVTALGWMILMFLVFVGSTAAGEIYTSYAAWGAGGISGAITAWLGKSSLTPAKGPAKSALGISSNIILGIAAPVFAVILIVMTSAVLDEALFGEPLIRTKAFTPVTLDESWPDWPGGWSLMIAIGIACVLGAIASAVVNINRFSLHAMYRNRLIRGFLGASHADERKPDRFTDFDFSDNPRMSELWPPQEMWDESRDKDWQPFHIVNIALNVVSSKRLAWQERKAEPFTVSPLHAGSACGGRARDADGVWVSHGAYRPSAEYGSRNGISLGTALAISGAAASPNMGYHSSAALAFLLTLFNVRLGWWLGNPGKDDYASEGPRLAIAPLLNEMFGQTTDERKYVYLSDGGHFENLGLYEMVRRRCRLIVVSDAACDRGFGFGDLGNAVRKIALDLGVEITINRLEGLKPRGNPDVGPDQPYCSIGEIDYPTTDGSAARGVLIYVKSGYHGVESAAVRAYAIANPDFPHETTGDQFFSESQFESYRSLGFEIVDGFLNRAFSGANRPKSWTVDEIAKALAHG